MGRRHHFISSWAWGIVPMTSPLWNLSFSGFLGVNLFFILSGFILVHTYVRPDGTIRGTSRMFWVARFARIYPVYLLGILVAALPYMWNHLPQATPLRTGLSVMTLTQAWQPYVGTAWDAPGWSLSAEAFFYLLFPLLVPFLGRLQRRGLIVTLIFAWLVALAPAILYMVLNPDHQRTTWFWSNGWWLWLVQYHPLIRLPEFVLGMAMGRLFQLTPASPRRPYIWLALGGGGALLALVQWPYSLLHNGLLDPFFALLIFGLAQRRGTLAAILSHRAFIRLGEASYALYILHYPLYAWYARFIGVPPASDPRCLLAFAAYLCLLIALCLGVFRYIEQPAREAIRSLVLSNSDQGYEGVVAHTTTQSTIGA